MCEGCVRARVCALVWVRLCVYVRACVRVCMCVCLHVRVEGGSH